MTEKTDLSYYEYWLTKEHWTAHWGIKLICDYINCQRSWEPADSYEDITKAFFDKTSKQMYEDKDSGFMLYIAYDSTKEGMYGDWEIRGIDIYRSHVAPKKFIKWVNEKGYPLPYEFQLCLGIEKTDERFTQRDEFRMDKAVCQGIAATLWDIYPKLTAEEMQNHHAIKVYGGAREYKGESTVKLWLREVDPRRNKKS